MPVERPLALVFAGAPEAPFVVVDKPPNLLCHPTRPTGERTLLDMLREQFPEAAPAFVNRLDRETSGLVMAALDRDACSELGKMTQRREIKKTYRAIVWGGPPDDHGIIEAPLARLGLGPDNPIYLRQAVVAGGHPSRTEYWVEHRAAGFSLLSLVAHTGRLHQLRVHLHHLGFPIVGDKIYGPNPLCYLEFIETGWTSSLERQLLLPRQALHSSTLSFQWRSEAFHFCSPLPPDLRSFLGGGAPSS
jgi:23S rRNA pseudouridine1911/1915/1917 synthase